jgi:hypothetical protein
MVYNVHFFKEEGPELAQRESRGNLLLDKEEVPSREACSATTASNRSSALF